MNSPQPLIAINLTERERKKRQNWIFCCSCNSTQGRMPLSGVFLSYISSLLGNIPVKRRENVRYAELPFCLFSTL